MEHNQEETRRLSIDLPKAHKDRLDQIIPWGLLSPIFRAVVEDLLVVLEDPEHRKEIIGGIVNRQIRTQRWSSWWPVTQTKPTCKSCGMRLFSKALTSCPNCGERVEDAD